MLLEKKNSSRREKISVLGPVQITETNFKWHLFRAHTVLAFSLILLVLPQYCWFHPQDFLPTSDQGSPSGYAEVLQERMSLSVPDHPTRSPNVYHGFWLGYVPFLQSITLLGMGCI